MRIAITGAAGWLGRYVTAALESEHELVLVDNVDAAEATIFDPTSPSGRKREPLVSTWPYHQVDISDQEGLTQAFGGCEVVIHLAALPTGEWERGHLTMSTNVMGTFTAFDVARQLDVRRIVNASSINAFGTFFWRVTGLPPVYRSLPLAEDEPVVPEDPYSLSKVITEEIGRTFRRAFQMQVVNLRFAGVWSEQSYEHALEDGLPPTDGWADDLFQWVHVRDVAHGIARAALVAEVVPLPITLAAADTRAPEPSVELLERFRPELLPHVREPLIERASLLSIARARTFLGYEPRHSFDGACG